MKGCPDCNRTFEDTLTFCLVDGAILSAPFDTEATVVSRGNLTVDDDATLVSYGMLSSDPEATVVRHGSLTTDPSRAGHTSYYSFPRAENGIASREPRREADIWLWLKLVLAITLSFFLSLIASGIALAILLNTLIFLDLLHGARLDGIIMLVAIVVFLLVFGSLLALTARWWRRTRR